MDAPSEPQPLETQSLETQSLETQSFETQSFRAVEVVPQGAASLGVLSLLSTAALPLLGEAAHGNGLVLMGVLMLATVGVTLGLCGVVLALRDKRHLGLALLGSLGSLSLPAYLLAGMPWN
jgi:hypothetical protein